MTALIYASADYDGLELRTMAQACILLVGESRLAQVLNAGQDPHLTMAAAMLGITYEQAEARLKAHKAAKRSNQPGDPEIENTRTAAKGMNFGFPGGLGAKSFPVYAWKAYKVRITEERTRELKQVWLATFPEFRKYFDRIGNMTGAEGCTFRHFFSGRVRGNAAYTEACNSFFQGLGADATGNAAFLISEACYTETHCRGCGGNHELSHGVRLGDLFPEPCSACNGSGVSPLYGTRMVNYVHDEFILETPEHKGHEVAHELVRIMIEGAAPYLPDVPAKAEPKLMRFWSKDAQQVWEQTPQGKRLVAWPKAAA